MKLYWPNGAEDFYQAGRDALFYCPGCDSIHELAGQTVALPDYPEKWR